MNIADSALMVLREHKEPRLWAGQVELWHEIYCRVSEWPRGQAKQKDLPLIHNRRQPCKAGWK